MHLTCRLWVRYHRCIRLNTSYHTFKFILSLLFLMFHPLPIFDELCYIKKNVSNTKCNHPPLLNHPHIKTHFLSHTHLHGDLSVFQQMNVKQCTLNTFALSLLRGHSAFRVSSIFLLHKSHHYLMHLLPAHFQGCIYIILV